jgi:hypothetical protein
LKPDWFPDWTGETVVIVASGPSAASAELSLAKGKAKFIAINKSHELAPWADAIYCCDSNYWRHVHGLPEYTGLKMTGEYRPVMEPWNIKAVNISKHFDRLILDKPGHVGSGGNSGFQALNLAVQFGARKIVLVGYDLRVDHGLHWHGPHPKGMNNPGNGLGRWRRSIDGAMSDLAKLDIQVINASMVSMLQNYPKMTFAEAMA